MKTRHTTGGVDAEAPGRIRGITAPVRSIVPILTRVSDPSGVGPTDGPLHPAVAAPRLWLDRLPPLAQNRRTDRPGRLRASSRGALGRRRHVFSAPYRRKGQPEWALVTRIDITIVKY